MENNYLPSSVSATSATTKSQIDKTIFLTMFKMFDFSV